MADRNESPASWTLGDVFGRPHDPRLPLYLLPSAVVLAGLGLAALQSWDYWWHLTVGRLVNYWGAVPAANHYLYTVPEDAPSFVLPWLSDLLLYGLHVNGSVHAGLVVRNVVVSLAVGWMAHRTMRRSKSVAAGGLLALSVVPVVFASAALGPSIASWLLFPIVLEVAYRIDADDLSAYWLAVFPAAAAIWANLHAGCWMAVAIPATFRVGATWRGDADDEDAPGPESRYWSAAAGAAALALMLNPRGPAIYGHLVDVGTIGLQAGAFPGTLVLSSAPAASVWFYLLLACTGGLLVWKREEADPADALFFALLALSAILGEGGKLWFALGAPVALGAVWGTAAIEAVERLREGSDRPDGGGALAAEKPHPVAQRVYTVTALLLAAAAVATQPTWQWRVDWASASGAFDVRDRTPMRGVVPDETPHEPVRLLSRRVDPPRLFHDRRFGGYLLYHLTDRRPRRKVFVDGRAELPPPEVWREYRRVLGDDSAWRDVFEKYDVGAVLLSRRQENLVARLEEADEWSILMQDEEFTLLIPSGGE